MFSSAISKLDDAQRARWVLRLAPAVYPEGDAERGPFDATVKERAVVELARFGGVPARGWLREIATRRIAAPPSLVLGAVLALALSDGLSDGERRAIGDGLGDARPAFGVRLALGDEALLSAEVFKSERSARLAMKGIERLAGRAGLDLLVEHASTDPALLADEVRAAERITGQRFFDPAEPSLHVAATHMREWYGKHGAAFVAKRRAGK